MNVGQTKPKPTPFVTSPTKNSNPTLPYFLKSKLEDFPHL